MSVAVMDLAASEYTRCAHPSDWIPYRLDGRFKVVVGIQYHR